MLLTEIDAFVALNVFEESAMNKLINRSFVFFLFIVGCISGVISACNDSGTDTNLAVSQEENRCNTAKPADGDVPNLAYGPTCQNLITAYPSIEKEENAEDKKVLCPFLRLAYRSQALAVEIAANLKLESLRDMVFPASVESVTKASQAFGCESDSCGVIVSQLSALQSGKDPQGVTTNDIVDIGQIHGANRNPSGDCGYLFALGETAISDKTRDDTLAQMADMAVDGRLTYNDLMQVKSAMCRRDFLLAQQSNLTSKNPVSASGDTLDLTRAEIINVNILYGYLGGVDNGYVLYDDVDLFFHGKMPVNKTKYMISFALIEHVGMMMGQ